VVGEYQIQILSAEDATGLDTWLREQKYNIPAGAEPLLRPYVQSGMKFFVAKVDVQKVQFHAGRAMLSPLRFHYDSPDFALPVRLGLINANGPQDLLIHILAKDRYKVANYPNVAIPTNLLVKDETRENFGRFYVALFDDTLKQNPGAVVTEYAWSASSCDPCPQPGLTLDELKVLGADVLPLAAGVWDEQGNLVDRDAQWRVPSEFVLTRLHARYDQSSLGEDLVFQQAPGLTGGTGMPRAGKLGQPMQEQVTLGEHNHNMFQARYAILHYWQEPLTCSDPIWDRWGYGKNQAESRGPAVAEQLAFVARDAKLEQFVAGERPPRPEIPTEVEAVARKAGCNCEIDAASTSGTTLAGLVSMLLLGLIPRRRTHRHTTNRRRTN
jgi:MYXO-CTERM domain-containing protein